MFIIQEKMLSRSLLIHLSLEMSTKRHIITLRILKKLSEDSLREKVIMNQRNLFVCVCVFFFWGGRGPFTEDIT